MDDAEVVAATIEAAAPSTELSSPGEVVAGQLVTTVGDVESSVPLSSEDEVIVTRATADGEQAASIALPDELPVDAGVVAADGTVVYAADDGSNDAVTVQTLEDGSTRVQTVIGSADSAREFGYRMDGYQPYQSDTGEVIFIDGQNDAVPVAAPWATDADGRAVPTRYEVRGDELFQVVFPVAQANLAQGENPKTCLFFTAAPIPGVIWRVKC
ncbi:MULTISPECIES: hypothetical protein [unclassified Microbacterium]|uniref:hypothetical protein n=1 Tax=unclassified Microbacterium TaxID=2609290 RepID=UPI0024693803|nr:MULTISPECIES: hypothetical protein [unclassified Microbacterium]MDH5133839.1 hypothetical protein [Microbacterium sp. RD10]MDH5137595.1 hypothetical protein [Microbacterium sp. RD11]MDH5144730.1 hypothetical protein [Microbacterium sp. RD12]MDH5155681.1 hypothetical protein [Microbacterium sp. RD06]MDH5167150.1 hypothetical protein [Microbacterium sp. RD02]